MPFINSKKIHTIVIILITTQSLNSAIFKHTIQYTGTKWSVEKDKECFGQCQCDPNRVPVEMVCGRDGHTYGNKCSITCAHCYLANSSVTIAYDGECRGNFRDDGSLRWWPQHKEKSEKDFADEYSDEVEETTKRIEWNHGPSTSGPHDRY